MSTFKVDVAWAAGLFEGEGSFRFNRGKAVNVQLQSTDYDVLERLVEFFGGKIITSYEATDKWKKCYMWTPSTEESEYFVGAIYPYLLSRRKARADEWIDSRKEINGKRTRAVRLKRQIERLLKEGGLTQRQIADKVGTTQAYVSIVKKNMTT